MRGILNLPLLGQIPLLPDTPTCQARLVGVISHTMPRSPLSEAFKIARTNLDLFRRTRGIRVILVASPCAAEGKTTVASNLAICLAQAGRKVLLVDADLRRPTQHTIHGLQPE